MLSPEDNAFLTRVGPGTPMGELWRRFWLPALLPRELPEPDCPPVRVRLLGEDLVAFRDTTGKVGVVAENCPHRGASLFFGRNEEKGLRCVYHGWKFDTSGACVDMPNEPPESNFKQKVKVTSYSAAEHGGIIWIYLGPAHLSPELPKFEWCDVPDSHRYVGKWLYDANFIQPMEGELDSSHLAFLHRRWELTDGMAQLARNRAPNPIMDDPSPRLTMRQTDGGFTYGARRHTPEGGYYWRVSHWLAPTYSLIPSPGYPRGGRCWIPIDDTHTLAWNYLFNAERPFTDEERAFYDSGAFAPPRLIPGTFKPLATLENDFLIDRQLQKTGNYTGIWGQIEQDNAVTLTMGPIYDRTKEHLGASDLAVIAARRSLMAMARQLQHGVEPYAPSHGEVYRVRALNVTNDVPEFGTLVDAYRNEVEART